MMDSNNNVYIVGDGEDLILGSSGSDWWLKKFTYAYFTSAFTATAAADPDDGGSGGSGGGSGGASSSSGGGGTSTVSIDVNSITASVTQSETSKEIIKITNDGTRNLTITLTASGISGYVSFSSNSFIIPPGETKSITISFSPGDKAPGTYSGTISIKSGTTLLKTLSASMDVKEKAAPIVQPPVVRPPVVEPEVEEPTVIIKEPFYKNIPWLYIIIGLVAVIIIGLGTGLLVSKHRHKPIIQPSGLSRDPDMMAENILHAIKLGNYQAFTRDFSDEMKNNLSENSFNQMKTFMQSTSGAYISNFKGMISAKDEVIGYMFECKFEKENVLLSLTFDKGLTKVMGLYFDSKNIQANQK